MPPIYNPGGFNYFQKPPSTPGQQSCVPNLHEYKMNFKFFFLNFFFYRNQSFRGRMRHVYWECTLLVPIQSRSLWNGAFGGL